jgi:hypothetical protein
MKLTKRTYTRPTIETIPQWRGCLTVCPALLAVLAWDGGPLALSWTFAPESGE